MRTTYENGRRVSIYGDLTVVADQSDRPPVVYYGRSDSGKKSPHDYYQFVYDNGYVGEHELTRHEWEWVRSQNDHLLVHYGILDHTQIMNDEEWRAHCVSQNSR